MQKLRCPECGSVLHLGTGFTGADWDTEAGNGSGYNHELTLDCKNPSCGRTYPLVHFKNHGDFSPVKDSLKSYEN